LVDWCGSYFLACLITISDVYDNDEKTYSAACSESKRLSVLTG
jgi:hypothetical protein